MKKGSLLLGFVLLSNFLFGQIKGIVLDQKRQAIFAVNVYLKSDLSTGTTTDFDGRFTLALREEQGGDTLRFSFIGYQDLDLPLREIKDSVIVVQLSDAENFLTAVSVKAKSSISEKFAVTKIDMLKDVYLNPLAQGDPLKAITLLPSSTTADESASVSLRGSSSDRSIVMLNGVPIRNPVRTSNLNNQGFFSLFNPDIIDKQYVYASNPPLTYGNSTAGLVEVITKKTSDYNQSQFSVSLSNLGVFLSRQLKEDHSFIQVYSNYQFSDALTGVNGNNLAGLKSFRAQDVGLNFRYKLAENLEVNSYQYFLNEDFSGTEALFNYEGEISALTQRYFAVNNLKWYLKKGVLSFNNGLNYQAASNRFGNILSDNISKSMFNSINYKFVSEKFDFQTGISSNVHRDNYQDRYPDYFYAIAEDAPSSFGVIDLAFEDLESYLYGHYTLNKNWQISLGARKNIPLNGQESFLSYQSSVKFNINPKHSLLLSGGTYHNYGQPSFFNKNYRLLKSKQASLDYAGSWQNTELNAAAFYKAETEPNNTLETIHSFGLEFFVRQNLGKNVVISFSNLFLDQSVQSPTGNYRGPADFSYFVKAFVQYSHPKLFTISLVYQGRPGQVFFPIEGASFNQEIGYFEPHFAANYRQERYNPYQKWDLSISRYIPLKGNSVVLFASLNNIFNTENEQSLQYNEDYSMRQLQFFPLRIFYIGGRYQMGR